MLQYFYSNFNNNTLFTCITEQKIINEIYTNKFYIRSFGPTAGEALILDNNYKFFLLNKKTNLITKQK